MFLVRVNSLSRWRGKSLLLSWGPTFPGDHTWCPVSITDDLLWCWIESGEGIFLFNSSFWMKGFRFPLVRAEHVSHELFWEAVVLECAENCSMGGRVERLVPLVPWPARWYFRHTRLRPGNHVVSDRYAGSWSLGDSLRQHAVYVSGYYWRYGNCSVISAAPSFFRIMRVFASFWSGGKLPHHKRRLKTLTR